MKKELTPAEKRVAIFLSLGFTKKEIANKLNNSEKTICRHADSGYKKTGSRNLADITRQTIAQQMGITSAEIEKALMSIITVLVLALFMYWVVSTPEAIDSLKAALSEISTSLTNYLK